ncbi:MAG: DUF4056 domain-containing protein [Bacteroidales bacterium]|nr:DUF4056 domain-containing protein [Bacteroidales bacterium]
MNKLYLSLGFFFFAFLSLAREPLMTERELQSHPPKIIRTCCAFGSNMSIAGVPFLKKTDTISVGNLGIHRFLGGGNEGNGIVYTRRGGFIDIGHLRDCADWTAYIYNLIIYKQRINNWEPIILGHEGGLKTLDFKNPEAIDSLNIYELAGKIAYDISLWHEIATWFGASYIPFIPEKYSSFSPEDVYSNLLGVKIGILALKSESEYNEAMTILLNATLENLEAVHTPEETFLAMEEVKNIWWTNEKKLPNKKVLLKRNFGLGPFLSPWLVPGFESNLPAQKIFKPDESLSNLYEFNINLNVNIPKRSIFDPVYIRKISQNEFNFLINYIIVEVSKIKYR